MNRKPVDPDSPLVHLEDLLAHGETERLAGALESLSPAGLSSADELDEAARLCRVAAVPERAEAFVGEKLRRGEAAPEDYRRKAGIAASAGCLEEALAELDAALALDPACRETVREKFFLLQRMGRLDDAGALLREEGRCLGPDQRELLAEILRGEAPETRHPTTDPRNPTPETRHPSLDTPWTVAHVHRFLELFRGRPDVHARQWAAPTGGFGYNPVAAPLSPALVEEHWRGRQTLGVYQLDENCNVRWVAFDVDVRSDLVATALKQRARWQALMGAAFRTAAAIADLCAMEGLKTVVEYSGFKGYHVWLPLSRPCPAAEAREFGLLIHSHAGEVSAEVSVEVFPKQVRLQGKHLGNLIKLPLGVHQRTGRRSAFVGLNGAEVQDPYEYLFQIETNGVDTLQRCLRRVAVPAHAPAAEPPALRGAAPSPGARGDAPSTPPWEEEPVPYEPSADARLCHLLSRCGVLDAVVEKAKALGELSYDEQLAVVHVVGHLETGVQAVNHVLGLLRNPAPDLFLKSRLRGNPASCAKLRGKVLPGLGDVPCACDFGEHPETYPNPVLHLSGFTAAAGAEAPPLRDHTLRVQGLIRRYLDLRERLRAVQGDFAAVEKALLDIFREQGVDALPTPMGTLRVVPREEGPPRLVLEL